MSRTQIFISYATEDSHFANEIAYGLRANGFQIWFAPFSLRAGQGLLDSINDGLSSSSAGIIVISRDYLVRGWTHYEMDILMQRKIEHGTKLLPIWFGVTKADVEAKHPGIAGIVAITNAESAQNVVSELIRSLSDEAPTRAVVPTWEDPAWRFLNGVGEVQLNRPGSQVTTIFEFLLHSRDDEYPLWLAGKTYSKRDLAFHVAELVGPVPERVKGWVREEGFQRLLQLLRDLDIDPRQFY